MSIRWCCLAVAPYHCAIDSLRNICSDLPCRGRRGARGAKALAAKLLKNDMTTAEVSEALVREKLATLLSRSGSDAGEAGTLQMVLGGR